MDEFDRIRKDINYYERLFDSGNCSLEYALLRISEEALRQYNLAYEKANKKE